MHAPSQRQTDAKDAYIEALPLEMLVAVLGECRLVDVIRAAPVSRSMAAASAIVVARRRAAAVARWTRGHVSSGDTSRALTTAVMCDDAGIIEGMWLANATPAVVGVRYRYCRERRPTRRGATRRHVNRIASIHASTPQRGDGLEVVTLELPYAALWAGAVDVFTFAAAARRADDGEPVDRTLALWFVRIGADAMPRKPAVGVRPYCAGRLYAAIALTTAAFDTGAAPSAWSFARGDGNRKPLTKAPLATLIEAARNTMVVRARRNMVSNDQLSDRLAGKLRVGVWQLERMVERSVRGGTLGRGAVAGILGAVASADESTDFLVGVRALVSMALGPDATLPSGAPTQRQLFFGRMARARPGDRRAADRVLAHVALAFADTLAAP